MHRLLVETSLLKADRPVLPRDAAHHLMVLRPKTGAAVELFDGRGGWRVYRWADGLVADSPICRHADSSAPPLTLFACVTKGSRWDWTVAKATELGVARVVPVVSARTSVRIPPDEREAKRARWQRVAEDAARQSDAKWLPVVEAPVDFADALPFVRATTCFVGALADPPPPPLAEAVRAACAAGWTRPPAVFVGPEGDFTPDELAALTAIGVPTSFGPTILRAETAAIFAVSVLAAIGTTSAR